MLPSELTAEMHMNTWDCADHRLSVLERPESDSRGYHLPVMAEEVVAFLRPAPGMILLDGTAGGGGHTSQLLAHGAEVVAIDQDVDAIEHCSQDLSCYAHRLHLAHANYAEAGEVLDSLGIQELGGALLDLGVSSHQLDTPERGFSFHKDGPLDMRMNPHGSLSAAVLVNTASVEELTRIFREYGEEPRAFHVASKLVALRESKPFRTTLELAQAVETVIHRTSGRHPATKVFQALRIAVNDELGVLERGLEIITSRLARGARFAVITFHSLEDRIVKHYFKDRSTEWIDRPEWPEPRRNPLRSFRLLTPHPMDASVSEVDLNPRSRSAKLRVVERI